MLANGKSRYIELFALTLIISLVATPFATLPSCVASDISDIQTMVQGYYDAFNSHSVANMVAYFTTDGVKILQDIYQSDAVFQGHTAISAQLSSGLSPPSDMAISSITIKQLSVVGNTATVECNYLVYSVLWSFCFNETEQMNLVKQGADWKIARAYLSSNTPMLL
ncbi:nuclear transport factor 2 family protein, partial [Candidatus Bathyarchaeota archaeon]|nr:nuclear transport factor 2 family protein [Candidatus Bathyarchaeota archaeon]